LALLLLVPVPSVGTALGMIILPDTTVGKSAFFLCKVWLVALPLLWVVLVDKDRLAWSKPTQGGFGAALLLGVALSAVIAAVNALLGPRLIDPQAMKDMAKQVGLADPRVYVAGAAYWVFVNSLLEEYVWRWFVFRKCEVLMPSRVAALASAFAFTLHHIVALQVYFSGPVTALTSTGVFIGGAVWSWCYLKYRSIWPCWLSHAVVDVTIFVIGWRLIFG